MLDQAQSPSLFQQSRVRIGLGVVLLAIVGVVVWLFVTAGRESTDDAQVEGHVVQISARVGGTVQRVAVEDNQRVAAGAVLVELDPRDYQVAVDRARAELADAQATAAAAQSGVPISATSTTSNVTTAHGSVAQAQSVIEGAQKEIDAARARLTTSQARQREAEANAAKATRDVERLRGLLAKDEVSQQQFDAASAAADAQRAAVDSAVSQVAEAEAGVRVAESKLSQARVGEQQAQAGLRTAETGPQQVAAMRARAEAAAAHVEQQKAALAQAELNLQYTTVKAPVAGIVSRKTVEVGQIVQAGQPLLALIPLENVWVTANFKETQLTNMKPGQKTVVKVDAYGGKEFQGRVDSIAAATGARFSMLPPENATGNYVKVVQRVPVKIVLEPGQDPDHSLRPGMSVVPTVYTKQ
ncbi:MAG TPA: HlyD family secretion protein [Vicinamibacterales bacterium]